MQLHACMLLKEDPIVVVHVFDQRKFINFALSENLGNKYCHVRTCIAPVGFQMMNTKWCPVITRDQPILLLFSPIFLSSNSIKFYLLCSNFCSHKNNFAYSLTCRLQLKFIS